MRRENLLLSMSLVFLMGCLFSFTSFSQDQRLISRADSLYEQGIELSIAGQPLDAIILFDEVSTIREKLLGKEHPDYARSLNKTGNCYADLGDYDKALEYYHHALEIINKSQGTDNQDYAGFLHNIGQCYDDLGDYDKALKCLEQALDIQERILGKKHPNYASSLDGIGTCYFHLGNLDQALEYYNQALSIYESVFGRDDIEYAGCLSNIGSCYVITGDYDKALEINQQVAILYEKELGKEHPSYANALNNTGLCYYELGYYSQALEYLQEALAINEKVYGTNHPDYAATLSNIGLCYYAISDFDKALEFSLQALAIQEQVFGKNHQDCSMSLSTVGLCYADLGDYNKALDYHNQALSILEVFVGTENPEYAANLDYIGFCYAKLGDYSKALDCHNKSLAIRENLFGKEHSGYAACLDYIGNCYLGLDNYDKALEYYKEALTIDERILGKEHASYATSLSLIGDCYYYLDEDDKALDYFNQALSIRERVLGKDSPEYAESLLNIGLCYYDIGDYDKASSFFTSYSNTEASIVTNTFSFLPEFQRELFWNKESWFFTDFLFNLCVEIPSPEMSRVAYDGALLGKGLLLNAETEMRKLILESGDEMALNMLNQIQESRIRLDGLYHEPTGKKAQIDSLNNDISFLQQSLIKRSKVFGDYTRNLALKWTDIQKSLGKKDIAIEFESYMVQDTTYYLALSLKKGYSEPHLVELFSSVDLDKIKPSRYYSSIDITDLVWGNLQKELDGVQNVYFSPIGELNNIAIEYFMDTDGEELINKKRNYYRLTSTRELVKNRGGKKIEDAIVYGGIRYDITPKSHLTGEESEEERLAMVAERTGAPIDSIAATRGISWDFLPGTKAEAEAISTTMSTNRVNNELIEGEDGTEESFKALSGTERDVIHIATHGFYWTEREASKQQEIGLAFLLGSDADAPEEDKALTHSGLLFAGAQNTFSGKEIPQDVEDGILTAKEIARLNLRGTGLVVISACQSGLGEVKGDGVFGLQRGFKKAGVQSIVMSLWEVNDEATRILMTRFYENLSKGLNKYEAFQKAQSSLRKYKGGIYDRPDYYAAFVLLDAIQ